MKGMLRVLALLFLSLPSFAQARRGMGEAPPRPADWAAFGHYAEANKAIRVRPRVVFMGDSITEFWYRDSPAFFEDNNFLCRGISSQTVEQMLVRFRQDVIAMHPDFVFILAGINDIAENNGPISQENIVGCIQSMCELARVHGICPILGQLTPCGRFFWNPEAIPAPQVIELNQRLQEYADTAGIPCVDLYTPLAQPDGSLSAEDSRDGCHPTSAGYRKMEAVLLPFLQRLL